jgi:hypothetical protein
MEAAMLGMLASQIVNIGSGEATMSVILGDILSCVVLAFFLYLFTVFEVAEYKEVFALSYWRRKVRWIWPIKPKVYPHNINDIVADDYRRQLNRR